MSRENVETVQAIYDAFLARGRLSDAATLALLEKFFDPDVELQQMQDVIGTSGTFRGYEGLRNSARELVAEFKDFHVVAERHFDAGESVVTVARGRARGRASGAEVDMRVGHLWVLRDRRVLRWVVYATPEEALEAVGLRE
jgi:ketosteroid isomerase-like protein